MSTLTSFTELPLSDSIRRAVAAQGYTTHTPIQAGAIPHLLAGRDLLGCAQTGTGKTAAFALPLLERLSRAARPAGTRGPLALVLAPTRELAQQIGDSFAAYGSHLRLRCAVIFGGVSQGPQVAALRRGLEILVATPGRLLDLMEQGHVRLEAVGTLVLDEADRMLDMGFIPVVRRIVSALPRKRQSVMFSATMPPDVAALASGMLLDPVQIAVTPVARTADNIDQRVLFVPQSSKAALLGEVLRDQALERVLVFTRTKHGANRVAAHLERAGVRAEAIHGNKSQGARHRALDGFKQGRVRVLVATDIASRGIDVEGITHVINYDLPNEPESYVHRIGRTARAGAAGVALSFCDAGERPYLRDIERLTRSTLRVVEDHPYRDGSAGGAAAASGPAAAPPPGFSRRPRGGGRFRSRFRRR